MVNREASGLFEALRLQKLRAINYLLDHIKKNPDKDIAVAVEILEDVYVKTLEEEIFEQNKNYDEESKFTLNSSEILKTFCSFLDIWFYNQLTDKIAFCFLSTNSIGKESATTRAKKLGISFPKEEILNELKSGDKEKIKKVSSIIRQIISDFYIENYPEEKQNIELIKGLSDDDWTDFLMQISWDFGNQSLEELDKEVTEKIKNCSFYSAYENKFLEDTIKAKLLEVVETFRLKKDKVFQLVRNADVQLAFVNSVFNSVELPLDEVHVLWETIEKPNDFRNLEDKIISVCPTFSKERLSQLNRKTAIAKVNEISLKNSQQYLSLKYRIFAFCEEELYVLTLKKTKIEFTEVEIDNIISQINTKCVLEFEALKKEFDYGVERNSIVLELFIEFIDSCYLAFN